MLSDTFATVSTILGVGEPGGTSCLEFGIAELSPFHDDAAGEVQDGFGAFIRRDYFACVEDFTFT